MSKLPQAKNILRIWVYTLLKHSEEAHLSSELFPYLPLQTTFQAEEWYTTSQQCVPVPKGSEQNTSGGTLHVLVPMHDFSRASKDSFPVYCSFFSKGSAYASSRDYGIVSWFRPWPLVRKCLEWKPGWLLTGRVTLNKLLNLSILQFSPLSNGDYNSTVNLGWLFCLTH